MQGCDNGDSGRAGSSGALGAGPVAEIGVSSVRRWGSLARDGAMLESTLGMDGGALMDSAFLQQFIDRFDTPGIDALVLMGSHARGTNQRYSDVDLARFTNFTYLLSMPSILAERFCHAVLVSATIPAQVATQKRYA